MNPTLRRAILRAVLAMLVLFVCARAFPGLHAWGAFERLPAHDFSAEAAGLAAEGAWSEVLDVAEAGLALAPAAQHAELQSLRLQAQARLAAPGYRLAEAGRGALTGRGESVEALSGAVIADLFVFGDVRDLVIQSGNALRGDPVDEVLVGLSAAGIVLTVVPLADMGLALLKAARRAGAMTAGMASSLARMSRRAVRQGDALPLRATARDAGTLSRHARPGAAFRVLRHVDDAEDLRAVARMAPQAGGVYAMQRGGRAGVGWLRRGGPAADAVMLRAAGKGPAGLARLGGRQALHLMRPHPLLGLVKGVYKGNIPRLAEAMIARYGDWLLPLAALWCLIEFLRLRGALRRRHQGGEDEKVAPGRQRIAPTVSQPTR
jgi:hypothetical protein